MHTSLMKDIGYGKGYRYAHDFNDGVADMRCLPEALDGVTYYEPTPRGFEGKLRKAQANGRAAVDE